MPKPIKGELFVRNSSYTSWLYRTLYGGGKLKQANCMELLTQCNEQKFVGMNLNYSSIKVSNTCEKARLWSYTNKSKYKRLRVCLPPS